MGERMGSLYPGQLLVKGSCPATQAEIQVLPILYFPLIHLFFCSVYVCYLEAVKPDVTDADMKRAIADHLAWPQGSVREKKKQMRHLCFIEQAAIMRQLQLILI